MGAVHRLLPFILLLVTTTCSSDTSLAADVTTSTFGVVSVSPEKIAPDCPDPRERELVIFVHGIIGSRETWVNQDNGAYWPALISSDPDLQAFDIARLDYESYLLTEGPSFEQVADDMQEAIASLNPEKYRTVQFIAHSLGGNLVRRYLLHIKARYGHRYLSVFRLVIMLGTPGEGSYLAQIAKLASSNQQLRVLQPVEHNDWLQMLNATMSDLRDKHQETFCSSLKFMAAFETQPTYHLGIFVSDTSAVANADDYHPFDRDHISLVKPASDTDEVYLWVKAQMQDCAIGLLCPGPHRFTMSPECGNLE